MDAGRTAKPEASDMTKTTCVVALTGRELLPLLRYAQGRLVHWNAPPFGVTAESGTVMLTGTSNTPWW